MRELKNESFNSTEDDAYHTFFECGRYNDYSTKLQDEVGPLTPDNVVETMLSEIDQDRRSSCSSRRC